MGYYDQYDAYDHRMVEYDNCLSDWCAGVMATYHARNEYCLLSDMCEGYLVFVSIIAQLEEEEWDGNLIRGNICDIQTICENEA